MAESGSTPPSNTHSTSNAEPIANSIKNGAAKAESAASAAADAAKKAAPKQNPVFQMMGLPNIRMKLPSRNWMIFWTIIGSWTGAWAYDRRQKRLTQEKWAKMVSHLSREILPADQLPRKLTIFLTTPPADSVMTAREHFHEYVRPILAKSGLDWDAIEGRKEGDVRAALAERIRKIRKLEGEKTEEPVAEDDVEVMIDGIRERMFVKKPREIAGDIIIGRNAWKEYIRGLHEGWLGPLDTPQVQEEAILDGGPASESATNVKEAEAEHKAATSQNAPHDLASVPVKAAEQLAQKASGALQSTTPDSSTPTTSDPTNPVQTLEEAQKDAEAEKSKEEEADKNKKKSRKQPPPFIATSNYNSAALSPNTPQELGPSTLIPLPHILGFTKTPIRMYRFLNQRYLADDVGRQVAAAVLANYRPYTQTEGQFESPSNFADDASPSSSSSQSATLSPQDEISALQSTSSLQWEQTPLLSHEEKEWHKSLRKERDPDKESVWLDPVVIDERVGSRMRRFELGAEEEERSLRIWRGEEGEKGALDASRADEES